ncbi:SDR family NAD(P)-dependent oxidoreductase [Rhodococcus qingshengii]|uniref:SDR family NAD(P)-dependent oxidoreductase n=1 Tax=Rhodococcus qingshengii TaxID=334542 RepID=UPI0010A61F5F|nr:SDR family oxidoreductase [Rhodococcus qingshengii]THJ65717.1 SDR family oxidoreductase [Rhodococcus qingshengii]
MPHTSSAPIGIVTGAGSGIGRATVARLRQLGATVEAWDMNQRTLASLPTDERLRTHVVDITDETQVAEASAEAIAHHREIDFVVNCAGAYLYASLEDTTTDQIRKLHDLNTIGPTLVTQVFLPALRSSRGSIVNVASTVALKPTASNSHYAASKAALAQLTRCWALELGPAGIRVNAIAPGPIRTSLFRSAGMTEAEENELLETRTAALPLRRAGTPEEAAIWIARLALEDNWTTGAIIPVDGGMSL